MIVRPDRIVEEAVLDTFLFCDEESAIIQRRDIFFSIYSMDREARFVKITSQCCL